MAVATYDEVNGEQAEPASGEIRVAGIYGSLREGSYTRMAVQVALRGAQQVGAQTQLLDLRDYDLALCTGNLDEEAVPEGVARLREDVGRAHGIILGTPEYHGSFSGVLKNALDLMGFDEFEGKMIGLVGVSGGRMGGFDALNGLRSIGRALHAWVIPEQATVPQARHVFDGAGHIRDPRLEDRVMEVGRQVARFAYLHTSDETREFLRRWEQAVVNPGGANR